MWRLIPVLLVVGCNHELERDEVAAPAPIAAAAAASGSVRGAPHAGSIREVSVTDEGDAALSIDDAGTVRLWPSLDGTREPIPVAATAVARAAIVRNGDGWLVGLLDDAGSAHLLRFAHGGAVTAKAEVAGDVGIEQIVASRGGFLVRRADHSIELVDARGAIAGRVVAEPGEQIAAVVARGQVAAAVIAGPAGTANTVRWLALDRGLSWGARVTLPAAVAANSVAIAPSGKRLAGAEAKSRQLFVFDLRARPAVVLGTSVQVHADEPLGFVDDAHVVAMGAEPRWWVAPTAPTSDPWANTAAPFPASSIGTVGGGVLVSGHGGGLALATPSHTKYLGWQDVGAAAQVAGFSGGRVAVTFGPAHVAWLDDSLVEQRRADLNSWEQVQPVGDHHVVTERRLGDELRIELIDLDRADHPVVLATFKTVSRFDYEPRTHVFGVGELGVEHLWGLDLATTTAKPLPDIEVPGAAMSVRLLDPALAGGARLLAAINPPDGPGEVVLLPGGKPKTIAGYMLEADDRGRAFSADKDSTLYRDAELIEKASEGVPRPDHAGRVIAMESPNGVRLVDHGVERWNLPMRDVWGVMFSDDDSRLVLRTPTGLVMVDVATGKRIATACAWSFGLFDAPTTETPAGQGSVCEASDG